MPNALVLSVPQPQADKPRRIANLLPGFIPPVACAVLLLMRKEIEDHVDLYLVDWTESQARQQLDLLVRGENITCTVEMLERLGQRLERVGMWRLSERVRIAREVQVKKNEKMDAAAYDPNAYAGYYDQSAYAAAGQQQQDGYTPVQDFGAGSGGGYEGQSQY